MENEKKTLSGSELLAVMDLVSQKRLATAMNALKAEGLIFYAVALVVGIWGVFYMCWTKTLMPLSILYNISAVGAGYAVRNVRKTHSGRILCFLLTASIMLLSFCCGILFLALLILYWATPFGCFCFLPLFFSIFFIILAAFAFKATSQDLFWTEKNAVMSITVKHDTVMIEEISGKNKISCLLDLICVMLGWIFLLTKLLEISCLIMRYL